MRRLLGAAKKIQAAQDPLPSKEPDDAWNANENPQTQNQDAGDQLMQSKETSQRQSMLRGASKGPLAELGHSDPPPILTSPSA